MAKLSERGGFSMMCPNRYGDCYKKNLMSKPGKGAGLVTSGCNRKDSRETRPYIHALFPKSVVKSQYYMR